MREKLREAKAKKKKKASKKEPKQRTPKQKREKQAVAASTEPELKTREGMVQEVAKRWWYVMPEWPPRDFDYQSKLEEQKLRKVEP